MSQCKMDKILSSVFLGFLLSCLLLGMTLWYLRDKLKEKISDEEGKRAAKSDVV